MSATDEAIRLPVSLRDYFAGQALIGSLASDTERWNNPDNANRAKAMYELADAMLAARNAKLEAAK
jgi:hypothetical protein